MRICKLLTLIAAALALILSINNGRARSAHGETAVRQSPGENCVECHRGKPDRAVELFAGSVHRSAGISCNRCHGGDPWATDMETAHGPTQMGLFDFESVLRTCGSCHRQQVVDFRTGKHFPGYGRAGQLDCVQCHGAHAVGSPDRNFSFSYFCAGCHGLEYLPELPSDFRDMLAGVDDLVDRVRMSAGEGASQSAEFKRARRELAIAVGTIVHATDSAAGHRQIPQILRVAETLKEMIKREGSGDLRE